MGGAWLTVEVPLALGPTLESGQAFRWRRDARGFVGFIENTPARLTAGPEALKAEWGGDGDPATAAAAYLRLRDPLERIYGEWRQDRRLSAASARWHGLRLLAQDPFETTISFITSSASNIPKIARSIEKLAARFGEASTFGGKRVHAFPMPRALAQADLAGLRACELGYRARYVKSAAKAVAEGEVDLRAVARMKTPQAQRALVEGLDGVGPKVAACALLFSMGKDDAFPVDRWVQRCVSEWYFGGRKISAKACEEWGRLQFGPHAGYAQQYLFHDARAADRARKAVPLRPRR